MMLTRAMGSDLKEVDFRTIEEVCRVTVSDGTDLDRVMSVEMLRAVYPTAEDIIYEEV